jgi:FKBP-type peptidyl-prolyl cis-trans isomerase
MKMKGLMAAAAIGATVLTACNTAPTEPNLDNVTLETKEDTISYIIGMFDGTQAKKAGMENHNAIAMAAGAKAAFNEDSTLLFTLEEGSALVQDYFAEMKRKQNEEMYGAAKKEGEDFLTAKEAEANVQATGSGLLYEVITEGTGEKPLASNEVTVHYTGTLIDGTKFDSSYDRGEPVSFPLGNVIPGWTEGLQLMSVGSKYKLYIPYHLGYGEQGAGQAIPPYSTLIFEVELISFK